MSRAHSVQMGDMGVVVYGDLVVPVLVADGDPHNKLGGRVVTLQPFDNTGAPLPPLTVPITIK